METRWVSKHCCLLLFRTRNLSSLTYPSQFQLKKTASLKRTKVRGAGVGGVRAMTTAEKQVIGESGLLTAVNDEFGGVLVEMPQQPMDATVFATVLEASISNWRQQVILLFSLDFVVVNSVLLS